MINPWAGQLFLTPGLVLYLGPGGSADSHAHLAVQIIWSLDEAFSVELGGSRFVARGAVVPTEVEHALESKSSLLVLALVEPHGPRGAGVQSRALELVGDDIAGLFDGVVMPGSDAASFGARLLDALAPVERVDVKRSEHVVAALKYLERSIHGRPRLEDAAAAAHISPPRLTHLFTEEIGIPFRRFVLWLRLRRVVEAVSAGANLTEAAMDAGFSDSAHLSRVFRATFGLSPSALSHMQVASNSWPG